MSRETGEQVTPPATSGSRADWAEAPEFLKEWVEETLGSPVTSASTQAGGFSPGIAARLVCADGSRAFVKAVSPDQNSMSPSLHRKEARIVAALPAHRSLPRLIASYDDGYWVAILFEDIRGRQPALPWRADELTRVLDALEELTAVLDPCPVPEPADGAAQLTEMLGLWSEIAAAPPDDLDPWLTAQLDPILAAAKGAIPAGSMLVHLDLRADNLLLTDTGDVVLIDWAHGCVGPQWLDAVLLMMEVDLHGGHDVDAVLATHPLTRSVDPAEITRTLVAVTGMFEQTWRRPAPPGLPTIREVQHAYARSTSSWLRRRFSPAGG